MAKNKRTLHRRDYEKDCELHKRIRALIAADEKERLPLAITIDPLIRATLTPRLFRRNKKRNPESSAPPPPAK